MPVFVFFKSENIIHIFKYCVDKYTKRFSLIGSNKVLSKNKTLVK